MLECPNQLEVVVADRHDIMADDSLVTGLSSAFEVRVTRVHLHPDLLIEGHQNRMSPAKLQPLIMSFPKLHGVSNVEAVLSR